MKLFIGQVVLFAFALIVLSEALPTNLLKLLEQKLDAPVRRSACTYNGDNYDFGEVIFMIQGLKFCYVKYCDQHGTVAEETKSSPCAEPKVTSAPRRPEDDNGMPEIGGK